MPQILAIFADSPDDGGGYAIGARYTKMAAWCWSHPQAPREEFPMSDILVWTRPVLLTTPDHWLKLAQTLPPS